LGEGFDQYIGNVTDAHDAIPFRDPRQGRYLGKGLL
jgi:hypothetical protein